MNRQFTGSVCGVVSALLLAVTPLTAQSFDMSANGSLRGDYFVREIAVNGQNANGAISSATAVVGVLNFDGTGHYKFSGQITLSANPGLSSSVSSTGSYGVGSNGLLEITSLTDPAQTAYGGVGAVGPSAFVASATEKGSTDIFVGIPAGSNVTTAALTGTYSAGYIDFPNADLSMVREATFTLNPNGAGSLGSVRVSGTALNLGGAPTTQTLAGASYSLSGEGSGNLNLGIVAGASQLIGGSKNFYLSADGNIALAASPSGFDLMIAIRGFAGTATNASWKGLFFTAGLEDTVSSSPVSHVLDGFYGSWNSLGSGVSLAHSRLHKSAPQSLFDYTFDTRYSVQTNGTVAPADIPYQFTLGAGGNAFIATGANGMYSLVAGFGAAQPSGTGVYIYPTGIVNAATYAPVTNPVAPNEVIAIFGTNLSGTTATASAVPLPTSLASVMVTVNGVNAPLFYVSPTQIIAQVPQTVTPANKVFNATVKVISNGVASNAVTMYTNYTSPGAFSASGSGIDAAAATHADGSLITQTNAASTGETVVFYATGLGSVTPSPADGAAAPSVPLATLTDGVSVTFGGQPAGIVFAGLTPGAVALYQLNTKISGGTPAGTQFADISTPDALTSQTTVAIRSSGSAADRAEILELRRRAIAGQVSPVDRLPRPQR